MTRMTESAISKTFYKLEELKSSRTRKELALAIGISTQAVSTALNTLKEIGLVKKNAPINRVSTYYLTAEGHVHAASGSKKFSANDTPRGLARARRNIPNASEISQLVFLFGKITADRVGPYR